MLVLNIGLFLLFQVFTMLLFKWGGTFPNRYWWGFAIGNSFGLISTIMLINIYKVLPPGLTLAICMGGSFVVSQVAMFLVYKENLNFVGWGGVFLIFAGIAMIALFKD